MTQTATPPEADPTTGQGGSNRSSASQSSDGKKPSRSPAGRPVSTSSEEDTGDTQNALLIGIDLGTSRSAISSVNGQRKIVETYVGWPRDAVSRHHLGKDVLYGKAALDNRLALNLYRPFENGVIKHSNGENDEEYKNNLEASRVLLKHLVNLAKPGRDDVIYGVVGVPAQASVDNKQAILDIALDTLDSVMIVSEPFSVAYGMERTSDVIVIDIGAGTTDLCRMHGTVPAEEDQVSLDIAGDAVDNRLYELIKEAYPQCQLTVNMCKQFKENYGFVSDTRDRIEVMIPVDGKPTAHDVTDQLKQSCDILVEPILESIHKLVSSFDPEFQEKIRNNIILSGGGGLMRGLNKRIEDGLERVGGGKVTPVEEPQFAGSNGALQLALDMPGDYWEQLR